MSQTVRERHMYGPGGTAVEVNDIYYMKDMAGNDIVGYRNTNTYLS